MIPRQYAPENGRDQRGRVTQSTASAWDVVVLSFKLIYERIHFWIRPNILSVILSIPVITAPAAKAALYHTVASGLLDPGGSDVQVRQAMKTGFLRFFGKALLVSLIKLLSLAVILASIYFWITRPETALHFVSVLSFYGLVIWWFASAYVYPVMVTNPKSDVIEIIRKALQLGFHKPFESLLFALVNSLLLILGLALLGPVMLIVPAARSVLAIQGYWFLIDEEIPGFMSIDEYSRKKFSREMKGER
jgi:uncharacterized membrane protein YesL